MAALAELTTPTPTLTPPAGVAPDVWRARIEAAQTRALAADPQASTRIALGALLALHGAVAQVSADGYRVQSESRPGEEYHIDDGVCHCVDYQRHATKDNGYAYQCKHLYAVQLWRDAQGCTSAAQSCTSAAQRDQPAAAPCAGIPEAKNGQSVPLPEAAFSLCLRGRLAGQDAQLTVRGMTFAEFAANVAAVRGLLDAPASPPPPAAVPPAVPPMQPPPAASASEGSSGGLTFAAERLEGRVESGKAYWKLKGGRFSKWGVVVYPEILAAAGFSALDATQGYDLTGWLATYTTKEDGKPDKVTRLARAS